MTKQQSHDHRNEKEQLISLAQKNGLVLNVESMEMNESGMDFQVAFALDDKGTSWVLRKPRRSDVWERAENEQKVLKLVRDQLSIDVPNWSLFTRELIAYPLLQGKPIAIVDPAGGGYIWQHEQQSLPEIFFDSIAETLASLHCIDHDVAAKAGIRVKSPAEARVAFSKNIDEIKQRFVIPNKLLSRWESWLNTDSYWPDHSTLNHGDLHPPHMLVDESARLTGLIDWTEAECADPGKDFVIFCALFGAEGLRDLLQRYERYGGKVWPRVNEHIVEQLAAYPAIVAQFALITGKESDMEMAKGMIANWNVE